MFVCVEYPSLVDIKLLIMCIFRAAEICSSLTTDKLMETSGECN
jgi:hypothetical protein